MISRLRREPFRRDHERARELAAARLSEPLAPADAEFLDTHLGWCAPCRAIATEYEGQRLSLRSLRLDAPAPPRDLWARTAAAIEAEARSRPVTRSHGAGGQVRGRQPFPVAPLAGLLIVAIAVGASLLNGVPLFTREGNGSPRPGSPGPGPTPIAVAAREIPLVRRTADGTLVFSVGRVSEVCPLDTDDCGSTATIDRREIGRIRTAFASDVLLSPNHTHLVVLDRSASSGGVYAIAIADIPGPSSSPTPTQGPDLTSDPATTPTPTATATPGPGATPTPTAPVGPTEPPTATPTVAPTPTLAPTPTAPTITPRPTDGTTTEPPATDAPGSPAPQATPPVAVSPQPGGAISIAEGVILVGTVAGYSADGAAFAFTARPADGSTGPDVYVWRTSESHAYPVTADHDVVFADWMGDQLLVSRAVASGDGSTGAPSTSLLDPLTGAETPADAALAVWRPAVDPLLRAGVWWEGSVVRDASGFAWEPGEGRLVIGTWPGLPEAVVPGAEPAAPATEPAVSPSPTVDGTSSPSVPGRTRTPDAPAPTPASQVFAAGPVTDWQARWDETGSRLALWIADGEDPSIGRLSLYLIDPATGMIADGKPLLRDAVADEGFSIGAGRLAWTSPGDGGGTVVEVLAWTEDNVGQTRLTPGDLSVVVR